MIVTIARRVIKIVTVIAACLHGFQNHPAVKQFFYGLRPAVVAAIATAVIGLMGLMLVQDGKPYFRAIAVYLVGIVVTHVPQLKRVHLRSRSCRITINGFLSIAEAGIAANRLPQSWPNWGTATSLSLAGSMTGREELSAALRDNITELAENTGYHEDIEQKKSRRTKRCLLSILQRTIFMRK